MDYNQKIRYSRNISLPQIGEIGQDRLLSAKVLVVGAGGLGCPAMVYLAACGVGTIGIIDGDTVELSNLQRQILHETSDIGVAKTASAKQALHDLNPDINVICYNTRLEKSNIEEIIANYDVVLDGSDNVETRLLLNDVCYKNKKTLISAAIHGFVGHLYVFKRGFPCCRCIFPNVEGQQMPKCSESGVLGSLAGVMGAIQATEAIKEIASLSETMAGNMIIYQALEARFRKIKLNFNKNCVCCGR
jgi:adenylyltransferase/sulfurtransferase